MKFGKEERLKLQVDRSLYFNPDYLTPERMAAYSYQFSEIVKLKPQSILEIGIGNGLLSFLLKQSDLDVTTLDFDASLKPDITAPVADIPCPDESFDVVACFEVLEHLPFDQFQKSLEEIKRVAKNYAVISLPDRRPCARAYIPGVGKRRFLCNKSFFKPHEHHFDGEHYWVINSKGYSLAYIEKTIKSSGFSICNTYRMWEFPANRIFVVSK